MLSNVLGNSFSKFTSQFEALAKDPGPFQGDLEYERRTHQKLCGLVSKADDIVRIMTLVCVAIPITLECIILYSVIRYTAILNDFITLVTHLFWFGTGMFSSLLICMMGNYVNQNVSVETLDFSYRL